MATPAEPLAARPVQSDIPRPEPDTPPVAADIPVAEVTTRFRLRSKVVSEVKVRGGKGVLNGTPFFILISVGK